MAKTRKKAKTSSTKKATAVKKAAGGKKKTKKASSRKELDLRPFKKQLKAHVVRLSASKSTDPRVLDALTRLRQAEDALSDSCGTTMIIPLD